jgi:lysozyme|tara:strand:- start:89 stop:514 length:426 start_codon:yes stop_codon:yes gene_type:complete
MKISDKGINLIKEFEGLELISYLCPAKVWTIGYGHTKGVQEGMEWTEEQAEESLKEEVISYCRYVEELVKVPLNQNQFDALTSWTYNLGPTNLKSSTMLKVLNDGNYDEVPEQIKKWNKAGGQVLNGLIKRRDAEAELFVS